MSRLVVTALRVVCLAYLTAMPPQGGNVRAADDLAEGAAAIIDGNVRGAGAFAQEAAIIGGNVRGAGAFAQEAAIIGVATKSNQSDITAIKAGTREYRYIKHVIQKAIEDGSGSPTTDGEKACNEDTACLGFKKVKDSVTLLKAGDNKFSNAEVFEKLEAEAVTYKNGEVLHAIEKPTKATPRLGIYRVALQECNEDKNCMGYKATLTGIVKKRELWHYSRLMKPESGEQTTVQQTTQVFKKLQVLRYYLVKAEVKCESFNRVRVQHDECEYLGDNAAIFVNLGVNSDGFRIVDEAIDLTWYGANICTPAGAGCFYYPEQEATLFAGDCGNKTISDGNTEIVTNSLAVCKDAEAKNPPVQVSRSNFDKYVNAQKETGDMNPEEAYPLLKGAIDMDRDIKLIELYSQSTLEIKHYAIMNKALREDDPTLLSKYGRIIYEIMEVFRADKMNNLIPYPAQPQKEGAFLKAFDGMVVRGMEVPPSTDIWEEEGVYTWASFTSTSTDSGIADSFSTNPPTMKGKSTEEVQNIAVVFEIKCSAQLYNKNKKLSTFYVPSLISSYSLATMESEVLFPPQSKFRVTQRRKEKNDAGGWIIRISMEVAELPSVREMVAKGQWAEVQDYMNAQTAEIIQSVGDVKAVKSGRRAVKNWMTEAQDEREGDTELGEAITESGVAIIDIIENPNKPLLSSFAQSEKVEDCMTKLKYLDGRQLDAETKKCIAEFDIMQLVVMKIQNEPEISTEAMGVIKIAGQMGFDPINDNKVSWGTEKNMNMKGKIQKEMEELWKNGEPKAIRERLRQTNKQLTKNKIANELTQKQAKEKDKEQMLSCYAKRQKVQALSCCTDNFLQADKQQLCKKRVSEKAYVTE